MKVTEKTINLEEYCPQSLLFLKEDTILFDIETTGFSPKTSQLYMIGAAYLKGKNLCIKQFLTQAKEDEFFLLVAFFNLCQQYSSCITYNGTGFDIPYLKDKATLYKVSQTFPNLEIIDLYKNLKPYQKILKLIDLKQKTVEQFLGINRQDLFSGGELISHYQKYEKSESEEEESLLLLHNYEDVLGMARLLSLQLYKMAFEGGYTFIQAQKTSSLNYYGEEEERLVIEAQLTHAVPVPISYSKDYYYLSLRDNKLFLSTQISQEQIHVPYLDYKNYYYLKNEDMAVLKDMARYVDKSEKEPATLATAYGKFKLTEESLFSAKTFEPYIKTVIELLCQL